MAGGAACVPVEWTNSNMAASLSLRSSVSYVHSGNGHRYFGIVVLCVPGRSFVFFVVLSVGVLPAPRGAVSIKETRWRSRWFEDTHLYGEVGRLLLIALPVVDSLAHSFFVIDRSSSISQVHAFNVTDSCYRMTKKLNESNVR